MTGNDLEGWILGDFVEKGFVNLKLRITADEAEGQIVNPFIV